MEPYASVLLGLSGARPVDPEQLLVESERSGRHAQRLLEVVQELASRHGELLGPLVALQGADGRHVWTGARATAVRDRFDELTDRVGGAGPNSVRSLLEASERTLRARAELLLDDARELQRAAQLLSP